MQMEHKSVLVPLGIIDDVIITKQTLPPPGYAVLFFFSDAVCGGWSIGFVYVFVSFNETWGNDSYTSVNFRSE